MNKCSRCGKEGAKPNIYETLFCPQCDEWSTREMKKAGLMVAALIMLMGILLAIAIVY